MSWFKHRWALLEITEERNDFAYITHVTRSHKVIAVYDDLDFAHQMMFREIERNPSKERDYQIEKL